MRAIGPGAGLLQMRAEISAAQLWLLAGLGLAGLTGNVWAEDAEASPACSRPAHLLAMGGAEHFAALPEDAKAGLRRYGADVPALMAAHGGRFLARGPALAVIEGDWPEWKNLVVSEWPCLEAAQNFWRSDVYRKDLLPLRQKASVFRIALYGLPPQDPRATGVWTAEGGPAAKRVACTTPVYFLVTADIKDGPKLAAYRKALADSGIQYAYGAVDVLLGPPTEILEGDWPKTFNAKVTRWPCREAFDAFYNSTDYQTKYKPLRKDAALFEAVVVAETKQRMK